MLACGVPELSVEGIATTVATLVIICIIAKISVTANKMRADQTKRPKLGPASLSMTQQ